jgi:hypothetical protein
MDISRNLCRTRSRFAVAIVRMSSGCLLVTFSLFVFCAALSPTLEEPRETRRGLYTVKR